MSNKDKQNMILGTTIYDRIQKVCESPSTLMYDYDIRYLGRWMKKHPQCFPKFMLKEKFQPTYNWEKCRWEIYPTK